MKTDNSHACFGPMLTFKLKIKAFVIFRYVFIEIVDYFLVKIQHKDPITFETIRVLFNSE